MENLTKEQLEIFAEELKARTRQSAYSLVIQKDKKPELFDSKFGGVPYWDLSKDYPTDKKGNKLMLLAQLNFDKADVDSRLPQTGMLQFFIAHDDDLYGCDFDKPDVQDTFRVVYHNIIDYDVSEEQIKALDPPSATDDDYLTPLCKECTVEIVKCEAYMDMCDYRFEDLQNEILKEKLGIDDDEASDLWDCIYDYLDENNISSQGHRIFGYPYFTQTDPKDYKEDLRYYDTLLFQMDSETIDETDYTLWGDCGVGNFFINHKDLENKDFSKVLYNWDCY